MDLVRQQMSSRTALGQRGFEFVLPEKPGAGLMDIAALVVTLMEDIQVPYSVYRYPSLNSRGRSFVG